MTALDETHDPARESWVESANDPATDFPIQNLPFGRFRRTPAEEPRVGVAVGDRVLDLRAAGLIDHGDMNRLMAEPAVMRRALRRALSAGLVRGATDRARFADALLARADVEMDVPCRVGDYTDFYTGIHHATTVGTLFRPDAPLLPNYKWVPIGYHGRASTIGASGQAFHRPLGQQMRPGATVPVLAPTQRLDHELELGIVIGRGNRAGEPIPVAQAEDHVFGLTLLNDWSARDVQAWEYQPLGPFLSKNFATTVSPWIVTLDALAPFRAPFVRPDGDPAPLPYLDAPALRTHGMLDIALEVWLQPAGGTAQRLSSANARDAYWAIAQLVAHHSVNGCRLDGGDLLGTGTISGPRPEQGGSLLELTRNGREPVTLADGTRRTFLDDGDTVILRAHCERSGFRRIGFGDCAGTVLPAIDLGSPA